MALGMSYARRTNPLGLTRGSPTSGRQGAALTLATQAPNGLARVCSRLRSGPSGLRSPSR